MRPVARFIAVWGLAAALLSLHAAHFDHVVDDAFITFRYLQNGLAGQGLVFNSGERVEGYTNFLWLLMLAPGAARGWVVPRMAAALGVVCMAAAVALRWRLAGDETGGDGADREVARAGTVAIACAWGPVAYWAAGGLETGVFCLLVLLLLNLVWRGRSTAEALASGVVAALLCMARPDGIVYVAAAVAWVAVLGPPDRDRAARLRAAGLLVVTFAVVYVPYFVWRWRYYDALLPNTFYAKVGGGGAAFVRGAGYIAAWLLTSGAGPFAVLAGVTAFARRGTPQAANPARRPLTWLVVGFVVAGVGFVVLVGGDQLAMFRFMVPVMLVGAPSLWLAAVRGMRFRGGAAALAVLLLAALLLPSFRGPMARRVFESERPADADRAAIGRWLRTTQSPDTLMALVPAGILPYYAGLPTLDLVGLTDRHIARAEVAGMGRGAPGHERYDAEYVLHRAPDLVFLGACRLWERPLSSDELADYVRTYAQFVPAVGALLEHPEFQAHYAPAALPIDGRYAHVWRRRAAQDTP